MNTGELMFERLGDEEAYRAFNQHYAAITPHSTRKTELRYLFEGNICSPRNAKNVDTHISS